MQPHWPLAVPPRFQFGPGTSGGLPPAFNRPVGPCFNCGQLGHLKLHCPKLARQQYPLWVNSNVRTSCGYVGKDSPLNAKGSISSNIDNHVTKYSEGVLMKNSIIPEHRFKGEGNNLWLSSCGADSIHNVACSNGSSSTGTSSVTMTRVLSTVSNSNSVSTVGPVCNSHATDTLIPGTEACPIISVNKSPGVTMGYKGLLPL